MTYLPPSNRLPFSLSNTHCHRWDYALVLWLNAKSLGGWAEGENHVLNLCTTDFFQQRDQFHRLSHLSAPLTDIGINLSELFSLTFSFYWLIPPDTQLDLGFLWWRVFCCCSYFIAIKQWQNKSKAFKGNYQFDFLFLIFILLFGLIIFIVPIYFASIFVWLFWGIYFLPCHLNCTANFIILLMHFCSSTQLVRCILKLAFTTPLQSHLPCRLDFDCNRIRLKSRRQHFSMRGQENKKSTYFWHSL